MSTRFEDRLKYINEKNMEPLTSEHGEEVPLQTGLRHLLRTGKEVGADVLGLPGDLAKTAMWGLNKAEDIGRWGLKQPERLARWGMGFPTDESYTEKYLLPEKEESILNKAVDYFPGSNEIKSGIDKTVGKILPKNYLEATTEGEKLSNDFFGDAASLLLPFKGFAGVKKALKLSGLMNIAAWGTKQLGGGETAQAGTKLGTIALTSLLGAPKVRDFASSLYAIGDEEVRANPHHSVSLKSMEPLLKDLEHEAHLGYFEKEGDKQKVLDIVDQIRKKAKETFVWNPELNVYESSTSRQAAKEGSTALTKETVSPAWEIKPTEGTQKLMPGNPSTELRTKNMTQHAPYNQPGTTIGEATTANVPQEYTHMPESIPGSEYTAQSTSKKPMDFIPENHIPVQDVWEFKKDMNNIIGDKKRTTNLKARAKRLVGGLKGLLSEYGKENPRFWEAVSEADNIYGGLHEASHLNDFLQKHVNSKTIGTLTGAMLLGHYHPISIAKGIATGLGARYAVQGFEALKNSSAIRNYYGNILVAASKHDAKAVAKNIAALDKELKKEYPSQNNSADFDINKFKEELRKLRKV